MPRVLRGFLLTSVVVSMVPVYALAAEDRSPVSAVMPDPDWNAVFDRSDGWTGADAAGSIDLGDGRTLWTFGDTWIGNIRAGKRVSGATMVNNSIAVHPTDKANPWRPPDPRAVEFFWGPSDKDGHPTAWVVPPAVPGRPESDNNHDWFWATGGGVASSPGDGRGGQLVVFLFRTRRDPRGKGVWNFTTVGTSMAIVDNVSDPPQRWRPRVVDVPGTGRIEGAAGSGAPVELLWGMSACVPRDRSEPARHVLLCGTRRSGPVDTALVMARAPVGSVERFGEWIAVSEPDKAKSPSVQPRSIASGLVSEFSVEQMDHNGRPTWILIQSEPLLGKRIFARTAPGPEGPWSAPRTIFSVPEVAKNRAYFTYAAKGHASLSRPGELLVTYLVNSQNFGDLVHDTTIYHPKFLRISAAVLFGK
jgi:hypothetical protein